MDEKKTIFLCEDTIEGVFSGIYDAWDSKRGHALCKIQLGVDNYELFCEYIMVKTDEEKAWKVSKTICERLGYEVYQNLCRAIASFDHEKAEAVYKTIVVGLSLKNGKCVMNYLSNPYVAKIFELNRNVNNEVLHVTEFLRFRELQNKILFSEIGPKNDIITFIAPHFADRFPLENFMIYDSTRKSVVLHEKQKQWIYMKNQMIDFDVTKEFSTEEEYYEELFKGFCHTISIKERENLKLQQQMLPKRFQKYMTEFQ